MFPLLAVLAACGPHPTVPVEVAPVEVTPVEVTPVEVTPVEVAPVEVAPVESYTNDRDTYHIRCNDGSTSTSCTSCTRGCCSGHGGCR